MSCFHRRQSKEMDSEKAATSAAGPLAKRPERETTADFFMRVRAQNLRRTPGKVTLESEVSVLFPDTPSSLEDDVKCHSTSNQADSNIERQILHSGLVDVSAQRIDAR